MSAPIHRIFGRPLDAPVPRGYETIYFAMGCYWGVERLFWEQDGVWMTEVGFMGGTVENPTYKQVCTTDTGHAETLRVVYDPSRISTEQLLKLFWENHDPTQGNRQWNDIGSQYRSAIFYTTEAQHAAAEASRIDYDNRLAVQRFPKITTQILPATTFYPAEADHQQYLDRYPDGYCNMHGTGVEAPMNEGNEIT